MKKKKQGLKHSCTIAFMLLLAILCLQTSYAQDKEDKKVIRRKSEPSRYSKSKDYSVEEEMKRQENIEEADKVSEKNPARAVELLEGTLKSSIQSGDVISEAESYKVLGEVNLNKGIYGLAVKNLTRSTNLFLSSGETQRAMEVSYSLAEAQIGQGNNNEAIKLLNDYTAYGDKQKLNSISLKGRYKLGDIYMAEKRWSLALQTYQQILPIEQLNSGANSEKTALVNNKIGQIYSEMNQGRQAMSYLNRAQTIAETNKNTTALADINQNIGKELIKENKFDENLSNHLRALEISRKTGDKEAVVKENLAIANTYLHLKKPDEALNYNKQALSVAGKIKNRELLAETYRNLTNNYLDKQQIRLADQSYKEYLLRKDSLLTEKQEKIEQLLKSNISLAENQKHIELLEKDIELNQKTIEALTNEQVAKEERLSGQRIIIYSLIAGLVLVIVAAWLVYKNAQKRRIANQLLALKSLRSQMNPHFIFNALNSVNSFISKNDERSANKYLADFSRLMRMVMENSQHDFIPLTQEIEILELYLTLEHYRFLDKFDYSFEVAQDIDTDNYNIPPMLIQPYIENAVWHGLRYKDTMGHLKVRIQAIHHDLLKITIEDNGIGRKKSAALKTHNQKATKSTGIKNTENRVILINELFGKELQVEMSDVHPEIEDTGTLVSIYVPVFHKVKI